ncbi:hypothetical protein BJ138DRAFT_1097709 [Hygrophoropsis aurantiaca]|uniref:Uncharacterized protein n=1 Tax=Hygrophoropsis aurantiaca TaxID=72124 RepID=A0ACB8AQH0_9AGAM|nr:hypothetical protein BJ138DRAFT_1097709 [Hygrophoropsis aurantiaca]
MKSFASLALFVAGVLAQSFTINTPANVVECQPTLLQWSGGTAPYYLSILPGSAPTAAALEDLGQQNGTSVTWVANLPAGESIGLTLRDSTGATAQSAPFTINPGSTTCTNTTSLVPGPTGGSTPSGGSSTAAGSSPSGATSAGTSPSASPSKGAASSTVARVGAAGVVGAAVAAMLF